MSTRTQGWGSHFDRLADHVWDMMKELETSNAFQMPSSPEWCPRLNLYETNEAFVVCIELAGVDRDKVDVRAEGGNLIVTGIRGKPELPGEPTDVGVHLMEIDSGRFHRKIAIPTDVEVDGILASYRNGYLWVVLPRRQQTGK